MKKIIRFFNQNRKRIFLVVLIVVAVIIGIQLLNYAVKKSNEEKVKQGIDIKSEDKTYGYNQGEVSGEVKEEKEYSKEASLINEFINYCNQNDISNAYSLLTDNCKEVFYPTEEIFKKNYCDKMFSTSKTCAIKLWNYETYRIELRENLMATGEYKDLYVQDFYTVRFGKLNINSFIDRKFVNTSNVKNSINISVKSIDYFMDYTVLNYSISNNSDIDILLSEAENDMDIILIDDDKNEHASDVTEHDKNDFLVRSGTVREIKVTYNVSYTKDLKFVKSTFNHIKLLQSNYDVNNVIKINIDI